MSITPYKVGNETHWSIYVNIRNNQDSSRRRQKRIKGIQTKAQAIRLEKKLIKDLSGELVNDATAGLQWDEVITSWESKMLEPNPCYRFILSI